MPPQEIPGQLTVSLAIRVYLTSPDILSGNDSVNWFVNEHCLFVCVQVMFGSGANEGTGLQGALPVSVFEALNRQFGVSFECFASPLNCYFKQFSSAFPDIDGYFGSRG